MYILQPTLFFNDEDFRKLTGRRPNQVFHTVFRVYENKWDASEGTVLAEDIVDTALTAEKLFPEKRKIIHFMQPHHPFIPVDLDYDLSGFSPERDDKQEAYNVLQLGEEDLISDDKIWNGYKENLEYVLSYVDDLSAAIGGRVVITSDHGNLWGEAGCYGHI